MAFIEIENITRYFGKVHALNGVNLNLQRGQQYAIQGSSGCGKSTLLYLLGGLDHPTSGTITVDNKVLGEMSDDELAAYRNQSIGFVFQFHFLLPSMNCLDNILLPAKISGTSTKLVKEKCLHFAQVLGVTHVLKKFPFELSGGEQQRVNLIRALSMGPEILLCDEPTGNLDSENGQIVTQLLKDMAVQLGSTLVVVTHDKQVASQFPHQVFMRDGVIVN